MSIIGFRILCKQKSHDGNNRPVLKICISYKQLIFYKSKFHEDQEKSIINTGKFELDDL